MGGRHEGQSILKNSAEGNQMIQQTLIDANQGELHNVLQNVLLHFQLSPLLKGEATWSNLIGTLNSLLLVKIQLMF